MTTSKLPEWPEKPTGGAIFSDNVWSHYYNDTAEAALARMEALVEFIQDNRHDIQPPLTHDESRQMDALLAACARKEAGR